VGDGADDALERARAVMRVRLRHTRLYFDLFYSHFWKCTRCGAHHGMASDIAQKGDIRPGLCDICKGRVVCVGYNEIPDDY